MTNIYKIEIERTKNSPIMEKIIASNIFEAMTIIEPQLIKRDQIISIKITKIG